MFKTRFFSMLVLLMTAVTGARAQWTGGTYTATANENLGAITVNGDATLTINSDVTVTVTGGINVASGTLTVTGPGTLVVNGAKGNNGASGFLDGGNGGNGGVAISGNIIVQGGATVTATGGNGGNGGNSGGETGGNGGNGGNAFAGTLTYKSGTVTANGGSGGSGGTGMGGMANGSSGSAGKAFANDVDFSQTTGYSVTNGTSTIGSVLNQTKVVISGGTPIPDGYSVTLKEGTDDATSWTITPAEATTTGVAQGTQVTASYGGVKKVKSVKAVKKTQTSPFAGVTTSDRGKVIGADGKIYANAAAANAASTTALAVIAYVGSETGDDTYKNGLAIALDDEVSMNWSTAKSTCEGKTAITGAKWCLPSRDQWTQMFAANGGNGGSYTGLNTTINTAGGTTLQGNDARYWSSSEYEPGVLAYKVTLRGNGNALWSKFNEDQNGPVRACLAF